MTGAVVSCFAWELFGTILPKTKASRRTRGRMQEVGYSYGLCIALQCVLRVLRVLRVRSTFGPLYGDVKAFFWIRSRALHVLGCKSTAFAKEPVGPRYLTHRPIAIDDRIPGNSS